MARKKTPPADKPPEQPGEEPQVPPATKPPRKGSQHRPRVMIALRPAIYDLLTEHAKKQRRAASWELHNILLDFFVSKGEITQAEADALWDDVIRRKDGGE